MDYVLKTIKDFPEYQMSSHGEIISYHSKIPYVLKPHLRKNVYVVGLSSKGIRKSFTLNRLYAETFGVSNKEAMDIIDRNYRGYYGSNKAKKNIKRWLLMKIAECEQEEKNGINRHDEILYLREFLDELCMIPV